MNHIKLFESYYNDLEYAREKWNNADLEQRLFWLASIGYDSPNEEKVANKDFDDWSHKVQSEILELFNSFKRP